jgi:hypothetical protein
MSEIFYEPIESSDELARLVDGMKRYARSTEFDYEVAKQEALQRQNSESVTLSVQGEEAEVIRARGKELLPSMVPYTKLIELVGETLQVTYMEFPAEDDQWFCQLQIINGYKIPLAEGAMEVADRFLDNEKGAAIPDNTPPHVFVAFQEVQR